MLTRQFAAACIAAGVGGCAIHPLPEDVTGYRTYDIVQKIRCEAREAVKSKLIAFLTYPDSPPRTQEIGRELQDGRRSFKNFDTGMLDKTTRRYVDLYANSAIAYDFTFDITEKNNLGGSLNLIYPFSVGTNTLGLGAGNNLQRENNRNFKISDNFHDLLLEVDDSYCLDVRAGENWIYPITGTIGLKEMIDTFIDLNQSGNLIGKENTVPTMADTLEFQTMFSGSATPKIELSPAPNRLRVANASLMADASRLDKHKVIVALSLPVHSAKPPAGKKSAKAPGPRGKTGAEFRALDELQVQKQLNFLNRIDQTNKLLGVE
jgi:hypothetical protein